MAEADSVDILGQSWVVRLGAAMLLAYALITGFAVYQAAHRAAIEKVNAPTALGDKAYFPNPGSFDPSTPMANFEGHSLYFVDWLGTTDSKMIRAGMDDTNSFVVYKLGEAKGAEAGYYYLKIQNGFYAKAKRP